MKHIARTLIFSCGTLVAGLAGATVASASGYDPGAGAAGAGLPATGGGSPSGLIVAAMVAIGAGTALTVVSRRRNAV